MKKIKLIILAMASLMTLTACFPTGENVKSEQLENIKSREIPRYIKLDAYENLAIDAKVIADVDKDWYEYKASIKKWDIDKVRDVLAPDKVIKERVEDVNLKSYMFDDSFCLYLDEGSIRFDNQELSNRHYDKHIHKYSSFVADDLENDFPKENLDNVNKEEAVTLVRNKIKDLGIEVKEEPRVIAMDVDNLTKLTDYNEDTPESKRQRHIWEKDDEAYAIIFYGLQEGNKVTSEGYMTNSDYAIGTRIKSLVSKDGLISLSISDVYEIKEKSELSKEICSPNHVVDVIKDKYKDVILTDPVEVSEIKLEYLPKAINLKENSYSLSPFWVCNVSQTQELTKEGKTEKVTSNFKIFIDAISGNEFSIGGMI